MRGYIIRRLLLIIPTLWVLASIVFLTLRFIPGDAVDVMASMQEQRGSLDREAIARIMGLDVPTHVQYVRWMGGLARGDLGKSLFGFTPVIDLMRPRLAVTFELGLMALLISLAVALPIGISSAVRQDSLGDYAERSLAIVFISVPTFWMATVVLLYPSVWWGWSPQVRLIRFAEDPWGNVVQFLIPASVLGMVTSGTIMRMTRTMMLEVLRQDYIRTAWSKGLRERSVIIGHALKNAFIPVITMVGLEVPLLVGGSVIIERIFNLPGMGNLLLQALSTRDYPVVSAVNLVFATAVMAIAVFSGVLPRPAALDTGEGVLPVCVKAGTAVLFDRRIWHRRGVNTSDVSRRAIMFGYSYRWLRGLDYNSVPAEVLAKCDPIRRQLLGDGVNYKGWWQPTEADVPLKGWLRDHRGEEHPEYSQRDDELA